MGSSKQRQNTFTHFARLTAALFNILSYPNPNTILPGICEPKNFLGKIGITLEKIRWVGYVSWIQIT
jgi:hypothetical protein